MLRTTMLVQAVVAILAGGLAQRAPLDQSPELLVPNAPSVVDVGGTPHLVHELHVTNMRRDPLTLGRVQIVVPGGTAPIADLQAAELTRVVARPGLPRDAPDALVVGPGQRMVVYFWIPLASAARPIESIAHRIEFAQQSDARKIEVEGGATRVAAAAPVVLDPPLAGGPWVAIYDPQLMGGHRTAIYTLDGRARIPGRFAVDWIRASNPGDTGDGATRNGFGADVLAVADARVASAVDDMPDLPPGAVRPANPVPLERASGNYVALDLGNGRFAFYEHLRQGSVLVKAGDRVRKGQPIAQMGSSGSTSIGPHLHFHIADANATVGAEGQPFVFRQFEQRGAYRSREALTAGEAWVPAAPGQERTRRLQHPAAMSVVQF